MVAHEVHDMNPRRLLPLFVLLAAPSLGHCTNAAPEVPSLSLIDPGGYSTGVGNSEVDTVGIGNPVRVQAQMTLATADQQSQLATCTAIQSGCPVDDEPTNIGFTIVSAACDDDLCDVTTISVGDQQSSVQLGAPSFPGTVITIVPKAGVVILRVTGRTGTTTSDASIAVQVAQPS